MNSDHDFTLSPSESASSGSARNRFLDSLGLGENALRGLDESQEKTSGADEGVVLSSQPDLESLEASIDLSKGRAISISVNRGAAANRSLEISVPVAHGTERPTSVQNETPVCANTVESKAPESEEQDLEAIINLNCPECSGDLVIKRRHLGVEGACVWCHAPIVAAESARDHQVRVFPILGGYQKAPAVNIPEGKTQIDASPDPSPAPWKPLDPASETARLKPLDPETPQTAPHSAAEHLRPADLGFSPSFESAAPAVEPDDANWKNASPPKIEHSVPMDLEDLYSTTGFGEPAGEEIAEPGFGEALANPSIGSTPPSHAGFGAFLQSPTSTEKPGIGSSPSPWPAESTPDNSGSALPAQVSFSHDDSAPVPTAGFSTPAPWGPPSKSTPAAVITDAAPELIPAESSPADWASAFEDLAEPVNASVSPNEEDPQGISSSNTGFPGFESSFGSISAGSESPASPDPSSEGAPGFFFNNAPNSKVLFGSGESVSMPGHYFATGSSSEPEPKPFDALFPAAPKDEVHSSIFEASETKEPNEAPAPIPQFGAESPFPSIEPGPSLFGESSFVSFHDEPTNEPPAPSFKGSAFSDVPSTSNPVLAGQEVAPTPGTGGVAASTNPVVPSLPPLAKPKPKVRKGFMVLMVIIVGFASGAALASFVLPVEEYVQTARAYMEKKFNPAGVTQQALPLPLSSSADNSIDTTAP